MAVRMSLASRVLSGAVVAVLVLAMVSLLRSDDGGGGGNGTVGIDEEDEHDTLSEPEAGESTTSTGTTNLAATLTKPSAYFVLAAERTRWFECFRMAQGLVEFGSRHRLLCCTLEPASAVSAEETAAANALNMDFVHWSQFWQPSQRWDGWDGVRGNWKVSWNKLNAFRMYEYDVLVHLDTDVVMMRQVDELFATVNDAFPFAQTYGHDGCDHLPYGLNGGVFVVHPTQALFDNLMRFIDQPCEGRSNPHCSWLFGGSEQTVLALMMGELPNVNKELWGGRSMPLLGYVYNLWGKACKCNNFEWLQKTGAIYHMIDPKPWHSNANFECAGYLHDMYERHATNARAFLQANHPIAAKTLPLST